MERRKFAREFKLEAVRLIKDQGVSYVQASQDLGVHTSQLRNWVKKLADDSQHAFPGQGQMKPEQLEIARLKREVTKLKAEQDILKKPLPASRRNRRKVLLHCEAPGGLAGELDILDRGRMAPRGSRHRSVLTARRRLVDERRDDGTARHRRPGDGDPILH
jgi:transposase